MRRYRLLIVAGLGVLGVVLGLVFFGNLNGNLVYYLTPKEALARHSQFPDGRRFQLGGLVEKGSVRHTPRGLDFTVASGTAPGSPSVRVIETGTPSQLFRPGIGVVVEGAWRGKKFVADTMIVKHDNRYRPPSNGRAPADRPAARAGGDIR